VRDTNDLSTLKIDLSGLELDDIEVFLQEGSRGMPDFAASCGTNCCVANACSCGQKPPVEEGPVT
jgi:hypothetical protein